MSEDEVLDFLEHYGVKGMKWGVRKNTTPGVPRRTDREAKKDAQEFARAKMFYGTGAGTRRKLIRESVKAKSARNPAYKKAFDKHLGDQDLSKHGAKATSERKRTDRKTTAKQRAGFFARSATGQMGTQAAFMAVAAGGVSYLNSQQGRATMQRTVAQVSSMYKNATRTRQNSDVLNNITDFLNRNI